MSDANKVDPLTLAGVWAPIILYPPEEQLIFQFRQAHSARTTVSHLICLCECSGRPAVKGVCTDQIVHHEIAEWSLGF